MPNSTLLPPARRDAVRAALQSTFGPWRAGDFRPLSGGASGALILRFEVRERPYALRLEPERIGLPDRQRHFACMVAAAEAGVAPAVHYVNAADGVAVMDLVGGRPLSEYAGGPAGLARALGALVARLQIASSFPMIGDYPGMIAAMLTRLSESTLFVAGQLDAHAEGLARIRAVLPWASSSLVPCHNDPNPRNILFDGERLWLIDWELAAQNDPLVDIAILSADLAETRRLEDVLLETAFGRTPDRFLHARLRVVRLLTRLFYGCVVLDNFTHSPPSLPAANNTAFTPAGFRAAVADGQLISGTQEVAYAFGRMSLTAFIDGLKAPGFAQALELVKQG